MNQILIVEDDKGLNHGLYKAIKDSFQISVVNDIRLHGLLKTIGTTGKQIKSILRCLLRWDR